MLKARERPQVLRIHMRNVGILLQVDHIHTRRGMGAPRVDNSHTLKEMLQLRAARMLILKEAVQLLTADHSMCLVNTTLRMQIRRLGRRARILRLLVMAQDQVQDQMPAPLTGMGTRCWLAD